MGNGYPNDRNDVSTSSTASTLDEKRKEYRKLYNRRHYAKRKEKKASESCTGSVFQSDGSTERTPLETLQTNGSQMTEMQKENVSCTWTAKRKEYNKRYYAKCKENGKRVSIRSHVTQAPTDDCTPPTTFLSGIDEVMHGPSEGMPIQPRTLLPQFRDVMPDVEEIAEPPVQSTTPLPVIDEVVSETSEAIQMVNSKVNTVELGTKVVGPVTGHKQPVLAGKKVALRGVQNDNRNSTCNMHPESFIPVEGQLFVDASKTCGNKRLTPDYASSPILTNNGAHEHINYSRRKYAFEGNGPKSVSLLHTQQEVSQISEKIGHYGSLVGPNQMASKTYASRFSSDEHRVDRFICLQNFIKQCDGPDHRDNVQLLLRLSPTEFSKHAVDLEKRATQLTIEEGKEMQRMQALNIQMEC